MISIQKMSWILQIPDDFSDMLQKKNKTKQNNQKQKEKCFLVQTQYMQWQFCF